MSKPKRPNGYLVEEYITASAYLIEDGVFTGHNDHTAADGEYTGRFAFQHINGKRTKWYTEKGAPNWLRLLWLEMTTDSR